MQLKKITINLIFKFIGWFQIIGAISGLCLIGSLLLSTGTLNGPLLLIYLVGIFLFIFSLYAGKTLIVGIHRPDYIVYSFINQALQLFQWSLFGYGLTYSSGTSISVGFKGISVALDFSTFMSSFEMFINSSNEFYIKINLVAAILIIILFYIKNKVKTQPLLAQGVL